jgi:hypothetical protein
MQVAAPHIAIDDIGDTRAELLAAVTNAMRAVTDTPFGPLIRALLSQIAVNPALGDPFRASVVQSRLDEIGRVVARGVSRGDLRADVDVNVATALLVGPVYFRARLSSIRSRSAGPGGAELNVAGWAAGRWGTAASNNPAALHSPAGEVYG